MGTFNQQQINDAIYDIIEKYTAIAKAEKMETREVLPRIILVNYYPSENRIKDLDIPSAHRYFESEETKSMIRPVVHKMFSLMPDFIKATQDIIGNENFTIEPLAVIILCDMFMATRKQGQEHVIPSQCPDREEGLGFIISTEHEDSMRLFKYKFDEKGDISFEEPETVNMKGQKGKLAGLFPKPEKTT